ncbi:MAG: cytidine deaminase [Clostridia bacterium]|nr:cytidine deaminase [Clostridia bacterium]
MDNKELFRLADEAKEKAYAPFSKFKVGAALLMKDGKVYQGCNIENSSFSVTICAERTAIPKAVTDGYRRGDFVKIAIASSGGEAWPCGICRQFMAEFCDEDFEIISGDDENTLVVMTLGEMLPKMFRIDENIVQI